jgi:hypothetical protein
LDGWIWTALALTAFSDHCWMDGLGQLWHIPFCFVNIVLKLGDERLCIAGFLQKIWVLDELKALRFLYFLRELFCVRDLCVFEPAGGKLCGQLVFT